MLLALALVVETPAFGQTSVIVEVRVLELSRLDLEPLGASPTTAGFAKRLSKETADSLASGARSKVVHRLELQATNANSTELRLDSRITVPSSISVDVLTYFDIGIGIDVAPRVFQNRDIALSTASQVRIRRVPDADGPQAILFESPSRTDEIRLHEGETIVLWGFLSDAERMSLPSMPTLPDTPILNYLYSRKRGQQGNAEIAILLTPRIVGALINAAVDSPASVDKPADVIPPAAVTTASAKETRNRYTVQVGAFDTQAKAESLVAKLKGRYDTVFIDKISGKAPYHVRVGRLPDTRAARELQRQLARDGFDTYLTTLE